MDVGDALPRKRPASRFRWLTTVRSPLKRLITWRSARRLLFRDRYMSPRSALRSSVMLERGRKYPYNPFYGSFSPRVSVCVGTRTSPRKACLVISSAENATVVRGGYGRVYGPSQRRRPRADTTARDRPDPGSPMHQAARKRAVRTSQRNRYYWLPYRHRWQFGPSRSGHRKRFLNQSSRDITALVQLPDRYSILTSAPMMSTPST